MSNHLNKLAAEFNRYFTSSNCVDVPTKVSVSRDEWRALFTAITQAESEPGGAREALERIASWSEHPAMLGVDYGSNGVRDYYRKIARDALTHSAPGVPDGCVGVKRNVIESALQHVPYRGETWSALNSAMLAAKERP